MSRVQLAIEVDSNATKELESEVEIIKNDKRIHKVTEVVFTVGGLASSTKERFIEFSSMKSGGCIFVLVYCVLLISFSPSLSRITLQNIKLRL